MDFSTQTRGHIENLFGIVIERLLCRITKVAGIGVLERLKRRVLKE
jgi:hypothetical protein